MTALKILYIDDNPEPALAKYLDKYHSTVCNLDYSDIKFKPDEGYESLINNSEVKSSNIIFIDSKLFEQRNASMGKFTGEEFKIILKKYFPFIEVIVITQNEVNDGYKTISKYDPNSGKSPEEYYGDTLPILIEQSIKNIFEVRKIASVMEKNVNWEKVMIEKIVNSVNGQGTFDELSKNDIDEVISMFRELQVKLDG